MVSPGRIFLKKEEVRCGWMCILYATIRFVRWRAGCPQTPRDVIYVGSAAPPPTGREPIHPKKPPTLSLGGEGFKIRVFKPKEHTVVSPRWRGLLKPSNVRQHNTNCREKIYVSKVLYPVLQIPRHNTHRLSSFLKLTPLSLPRFHKTLVMTHCLVK